MLVTVKRKDFEVMNDISLIWTCIEPTIQQIRGKNFEIKSKAYASLNLGQRSLLMFQMLYGHTSNGAEEFYTHQYYLLSNEGVWSQLKKGMQYFGDYDMMFILEKMEMDFKSQKTEEYINAVEQPSILFNKYTELSSSKSNLNKLLRDAFPSSIKLVATYIRNNTGEFVQFID